MHKINTQLSFLILVLLLMSGCSWLSSKNTVLDNRLIEAMQASASEHDVTALESDIALKVHYELKHKPLPNQKLLIVLEIKPLEEFAACAYAVKVPEEVEVIEPSEAISLGGLKAGETYAEEVWLKPLSEGVYEVEILFSAVAAGKDSQIKRLKIPVSIGPFQNIHERH